jgi:hypothetical protein
VDLENIDDSTLYAVQLAAQGNGVGISGVFNHNAVCWEYGSSITSTGNGQLRTCRRTEDAIPIALHGEAKCASEIHVAKVSR